MAQAHIFEDTTQHTGNFCIAIWIDAPLMDLKAEDIILTPLTGNGITNIVCPENLEPINYTVNPFHMLCSMHVEVPDDVEGSFSVHVKEREYELDNMREGHLHHDHLVDALEKEKVAVSNSHVPVFRYDTRETA